MTRVLWVVTLVFCLFVWAEYALARKTRWEAIRVDYGCSLLVLDSGEGVEVCIRRPDAGGIPQGV